MHILLTNDDGPLNSHACPYFKYVVDEILTQTDWKLSIVVPDQQRLWIGKAHFAGQTLTLTYIYTKILTKEVSSEGVNDFIGPFNSPQEQYSEYQEWCLINSTPAACADIGIHHLNKYKGPVDLVLLGPNFGKNTSNLYSLTSGTIGAAMELLTHGTRAIALSFAFNDLNHNHAVLQEAARISVRLVARLYKQLQQSTEVDLYTVNVPLVDSLKLGTTKIKYAPILNNTWGSIYTPGDEAGLDGKQEFFWTPDFKQVHKDSLKDFSHTDSRVLFDECVSVTPLKAAFKSIEPFVGEIILDEDNTEETTTNAAESNILTTNDIQDLSIHDKLSHQGDKEVDKFLAGNYFLITVPADAYIYKPLVEAFTRTGVKITADPSILQKLPTSEIKVFHYGEYEDLDIDIISAHPDKYFIPSYIYRKALIRKHYLAHTVHHYITKHPESILKTSVPESYQLEVDYAEFLQDALDEAYELRGEIEAGGKTWILKPSMSDKGQGIRLFKTVDQLQAIFDSFEEDETDDEGGDDDNGVIISQLRHFVVQEYKASPLLLPAYDDKKFHLRVYVVCSGDLTVYVYKNILALFADTAYTIPGDGYEVDMDGHLTNTCLQDEKTALVVPFWKLQGLSDTNKAQIFAEVCKVTGEVFKAATSVDKMNFQPLRNAVEIFGVDFLVNGDFSVTLLELNSYPDFKQTGDDLKPLIYELFQRVVGEIVAPMILEKKTAPEDSTLVRVLDT